MVDVVHMPTLITIFQNVMKVQRKTQKEPSFRVPTETGKPGK